QAADVVGRFSPFAARPVDHTEVRAFTKQDVPRMKISMNLPQAVNAALQTPAPCNTAPFDIFKVPHPDIRPVGVAVDQAHDALGVSDQFPDPSHIQSALRACHAMY